MELNKWNTEFLKTFVMTNSVTLASIVVAGVVLVDVSKLVKKKFIA